MNFTHYGKNLRSHENWAIILPAECKRPAWNYLKNNNAREIPPTFSYCYERNYYFFANFCKHCAILPEMGRKQILNFPLSLSAQYADADSWLKSFLKKNYLPETQEWNDTLSTTTDGLLVTISWHAMTYDFKHWNLLQSDFNKCFLTAS